jgi:DNA (cytosine-5)-methyltransferase 1
MKFGSVCSGIEAASVAWHPLGWRAAWLAEIEPFPSAVLAHHYPDVPNLGDMTTLPKRILLGEVEAPDLFCGGTPCQAFSVAGLRRSLDDERGNLSLTFCEIADAVDHVRGMRGQQPAIVFWENVPGVLSTADNAFGCFLAGLAGEDDPLLPPGGKWSNSGCVYGPQRAVAWRTLDAQYFGVAQRRRRVFVVASARNDFDPAAVLFEWDGVRRDTAPSREAGQGVAACVTAGAANGGAAHGARSGSAKDNLIAPVCPTLRAGGNQTGGDRPPGTDVDTADSLIPVHAACLTRGTGQRYDPETETETIIPVTGVKYAHYSHDYAHDRITDVSGVNPALTKEAHASGNLNVAVAWGITDDETVMKDCLPTMATPSASGGGHPPAVATAMQVRRLTPVECERLQGFPDGYTAIPWRKKPASECPDGPRYKALGNSWAVPVVRWIGRRIASAL